MSTEAETLIVESSVAAYEGIEDERLRYLVTTLIRRMHEFAIEVELNPQELIDTAAFLTACGQISNDARHEFLLLSDTLGLTMTVDAVSNRKPEGAFESSVLGPFYREQAPLIDQFGDIARRGHLDGEKTLVRGRVVDMNDAPIPNAEIDIWQAAANGLYENMDADQPDMNLRGRIMSDENGNYAFWTTKPSAYPIPNDGPAGELLHLAKRHNMRPAHIHFIVSADGFERVTSEVFTEGDPYVESDVVFGVKPSLIAAYTWIDDASAMAEVSAAEPFHLLEYDFKMVPGEGNMIKFSAGRDVEAADATA